MSDISEEEGDSHSSNGEEGSTGSQAHEQVNVIESGAKVNGSNEDNDESSISGSSYQSSKEPVEISPSERIRDLMAIDADVSKILRTAGEAMKVLTKSDGSDLEQSKEAFAAKTRDYTVIVQSVAARLRRQVYALEEANIITAKRARQQAAAPVPQPGRPGQPAQQPPMQITNGGLGNLDVSWLNSRSDMVGKQKEAELWAEARRQLESVLGEQQDGMEIDDESPG